MPQSLEIEIILGKKETENSIYYLAKWKNRGISEATWIEATWARDLLQPTINEPSKTTFEGQCAYNY